MKIISLLYSHKFKKCGSNLMVYGLFKVDNPHKVQIGDNLKINRDVCLLARGNIIIGNNVTLSLSSKIITTGYDTTEWAKYGSVSKKHICKDVFINDNCWIGAGSIILPGVSIQGKGVIVAAGAVVTKNISEDYVLVAGNPAKIVKKM
jgi:acetyltransferase-like isoleucine patch superfamily enzyme